ncbi:alkylhydroperoxidase/carboxymuconolactone decarboxylase family protein YurZ [Rhizobium fabae]|uniref:Alkylhydroperoxidase/carboxymuconolactone decarboxylase family protein YurZ n=1 Tax=Rhizobium fabae TaxID=573179 RepID=A0A7W6FL34_9HYPH|nr:alkylhydroperoxidase/carboxymuconolactone decarboxylase family protein YurZ [Rhizobium fabae]
MLIGLSAMPTISPALPVLSEYCWGAACSDNGLDLKQRSLVNLGMLAARRPGSDAT